MFAVSVFLRNIYMKSSLYSKSQFRYFEELHNLIKLDYKIFVQCVRVITAAHIARAVWGGSTRISQ